VRQKGDAKRRHKQTLGISANGFNQFRRDEKF
jgi:hypothetical protein